MTDTVPRPARGPLSPAALALRLVCEATSRALWGAAWRPGITELGWRLATEPVDSVTVDDGDESALADARAAFAWWADRGEVWLEETEHGLVELPIAHWIASRVPVEEPVSALEDPNVQLAVASAATRCARCGVEVKVGDTFGLVRIPDGPSGWCCEQCVTGAHT